jgi:hypothetical protein
MRKIILSILAIFMGGVLVAAPVFAECPENCVPTSVLGDTTGTNGEKCKCDDGKGSSILSILNLVVDIMTIGIGILGVIGISVTGIQYLTAGGSEEKTRKAKRRMLEIVIGLAAYVLIYSVLKWLGVSQ